MIKPGYKTSEFWFTLVSFLFSGLYLIGIIGESSQKEDLIRDVSHGVESAILIGGQLAILYKYINSRKEIKKTWWDGADKKEREVANSINDRRKKENKQEEEEEMRPKRRHSILACAGVTLSSILNMASTSFSIGPMFIGAAGGG